MINGERRCHRAPSFLLGRVAQESPPACEERLIGHSASPLKAPHFRVIWRLGGVALECFFPSHRSGNILLLLDLG